jgi:glycerol kinase
VVYALEGSVAVCGSLIKWLRDGLGLLPTAADSEPMARSVKDSGGVVIVPAFSGLLAPYWRTDARGESAPYFCSAPTVVSLARAALDGACAPGAVSLVLSVAGPANALRGSGVIVGLTAYVNKNHIVRAALEAAAFQTFELIQVCTLWLCRLYHSVLLR